MNACEVNCTPPVSVEDIRRAVAGNGFLHRFDAKGCIQSVLSPRTAARATFALNEGLWVLRVRLDMGLVRLIVSEQGRNTTP